MDIIKVTVASWTVAMLFIGVLLGFIAGYFYHKHKEMEKL